MSKTLREQFYDLSSYTEDQEYDFIRDVISLCFNPPDEDGAESEIIAEAILAAAEFIEKITCHCVQSGPDRNYPWDDGDQCERCACLGRYFNIPISR